MPGGNFPIKFNDFSAKVSRSILPSSSFWGLICAARFALCGANEAELRNRKQINKDFYSFRRFVILFLAFTVSLLFARWCEMFQLKTHLKLYSIFLPDAYPPSRAPPPPRCWKGKFISTIIAAFLLKRCSNDDFFSFRLNCCRLVWSHLLNNEKISTRIFLRVGRERKVDAFIPRLSSSSNIRSVAEVSN